MSLYEKPRTDLDTVRSSSLKDSLLVNLQIYISRLNIIGRILNCILENRDQKNLKKRIEAMIGKGIEKLNYPIGQGVIAKASLADSEGYVKLLFASDFKDCCAIVLQTERGVGIIHVSPYVLGEFEDRPTEYEFTLRNTDYLAAINQILHTLFPSEDLSHQSPLSDDQIEKAQRDLAIDIIGGNEALIAKLSSIFTLNNLSYDGGLKFPHIKKLETHKLGNGPKTIAANSKEIFVIGQEDDRVYLVK